MKGRAASLMVHVCVSLIPLRLSGTRQLLKYTQAISVNTAQCFHWHVEINWTTILFTLKLL